MSLYLEWVNCTTGGSQQFTASVILGKMQVAAGDVFNVIPDLQLFVAELVNRHFTSFCCPQSRSMHVHAPLTFLFFLSTNIVWFILGLNCLGQNCAYCFF